MSDWVLITGAAKRIGRSIAVELAKAGWNIAIHYHTSRTEAESLAHAVQQFESEACLIEMDLADLKLVEKLIPQLSAELGPLAGLINNASVFMPDSMDPDGSKHRTVNLEAPRILCESFFSHVPANDDNSYAIVNMLDADPTTPEFGAYNQGRIEFAKDTVDMARRFAPTVRVNGLALGPILPSPRQSAEHFASVVAATPLKHQVDVLAVAHAAQFLLENPSITGDIIHIDGGLHLK